MNDPFDRLCADLAAPLAEVRLRGGSPEGGAGAVAAVVLGAIGEPGDGVLGRLSALLGPVPAAAFLLRQPREAQVALAFRAAGEAIDARTVRAAAGRWLPRTDPAPIVDSVVQAGRVGAQLIVPGESRWPVALDDLGDHAPFGLWIRGRPVALTESCSIALVGARASTGYGELVAGECAAGLSLRGLTIVSGGAYGIDGAAHRAALGRGGTTVAFLAGGVDRYYPAGHERLLTAIAETGAVVSELACGAAPTRWRFLQRNRLIAAAAAATVVIEAGRRSGSLNTAGHAAALGRPIGAVPGPVTSPASAGCHRLLREYGALCVTDAAQMAELVTGEVPIESFAAELVTGASGGAGAAGAGAAGAAGGAGRGSIGAPAAAARVPADAGAGPSPAGGLAMAGARAAEPTSEEVRVLDALSVRSRRSVDEVARRAGLSPSRVMAVLGGLEATGRVARHEAAWVRACANGSQSGRGG